jgi:tetratricopeptide (TPR) repeat protein
MLLNESYMLVNQGQYDEAVKNFDKIIATYPTLSVAFIGRGTAYAMSRNLQPAIVDFSEAIRLQPDLMEAYKRRGQARAAAGQESEGIQDLNDALALPSMSPADAVELTIERGLMHQKMGNYPAAVADLRSGLEGKGDSAPDGFPILNHIGLCLTSMGQISAAIDSFKACLAQRPSYKEAMVNCAQAHKELGQFETSKAYFDKAIALADNFTRAYHLRGLLHHARGEHARAALDFEKVVSLERGETTLEALFMLSSCKHAQGHFRDAVATYGQVIKLGSTSETHSLISKMAFYQREMCLYVLTYADRSAVSVCWDDIMPAVFKEAWCKKSPPQLLVMRGYQLLSEDDCMDAADVAKLPSKPGLEEHCRVAQLLGAGMQYNTAGFMVNGRQHRMAGLATLECSQFMQVENVSGRSRCSWQSRFVY